MIVPAKWMYAFVAIAVGLSPFSSIPSIPHLPFAGIEGASDRGSDSSGIDWQAVIVQTLFSPLGFEYLFEDLPEVRTTEFWLELIFYRAPHFLIVGFPLGWLANRKFYRSFWAWSMLSYLFSPALSLLFLYVAGLPYSRRARIDGKVAGEVAAISSSVKSCPSCAAPVNFRAGEGVYSPEDELWRVLCIQCKEPIDVSGDI